LGTGDDGHQPRGAVSRREFLSAGGALALGAAAWRPGRRVAAAAGVLPGFPPQVEVYRQTFHNWSGEIVVDDLYTCAPRSTREILKIVEWARRRGTRVRPRGLMHNWSPLSITPTTSADEVIMVDTTRHLTAISVNDGARPTVRVETGATMQALLTALEGHGYGFTATPAPGDLTVGGALSIGGHGTGVRADGERQVPGSTYGSLSNTIVSLTAIVWDPERRRYIARTFRRADPGIDALLAHIGRTFVTEVELQVAKNQRLRCQSSTDIEADELLGAPGTPGRTLQTFLDRSGRLEVIWFPYTTRPWLKVWTPTPQQPPGSRKVRRPFNYPFSQLPAAQSELLGAGILADPSSAVSLGALSLDAVEQGLADTDAADLWGWSKNLLLYVRPNTLRYTANGYAILTRRRNVQLVVHDFVTKYQQMVADALARGSYPMNGPMEISVTGLDLPRDSLTANARPPSLSAIKPRPDHPEWDVAVWLDLLTFPGTPGAQQFMADVESWIFDRYSGTDATVRPEWSKGWAYTAAGPWTNNDVMHQWIPDAFSEGQPPRSTWAATTKTLRRYDPHDVFGNPFLTNLFAADD